MKINVDSAISGEDAIVKCQQRVDGHKEPYKVIVMDINMPGLDGVQTTEKIRAFMDEYVRSRNQTYIIVAHTALPESQFGNFRQKGFDAFLMKTDNKRLEKLIKGRLAL